MSSLLRAPFVRQVGSYIAVLILGVALYAAVMPAKVVTETRSVVAAATVEAPAYAQAYMDAMCRADAEYLAEHTHPMFASADAIAAFAAETRASGFTCQSRKYLGSYATEDTHVFAVVVNDGEVFYVITFDAERLVTGIQ